MNTIIDGYLMWKVWQVEISKEERNRRWIINFRQKDYVNTIKKINKATKIQNEKRIWHYVTISNVKLHEKEKRIANFQRILKESFIAEKSSFIESVCLMQNNDILSENLAQFHKIVLKVLTSRRINKKTKKKSAVKNKAFVTFETSKIHKSKITTHESELYTFRKSFFQILQKEHDKRITTKSNALSSFNESLSSDL